MTTEAPHPAEPDAAEPDADSDESHPSDFGDIVRGDDGRPLLAEEPTPPGDNIVELIDEMEERVLHGKEEAAHEAKEDTDAEEEAPAPEDVDASGGTPV